MGLPVACDKTNWIFYNYDWSGRPSSWRPTAAPSSSTAPGASAPALVPTQIGLERGGEVLIKASCPPYYGDMAEAVLAFIDYETGTFRDGGPAMAWKHGASIQAGIPRDSDRTIAAIIAYCSYV